MSCAVFTIIGPTPAGFVQLQLLNNLEQFCKACSHAHAGLYYDLNSVVLHHISEITMDALVAVTTPPDIILWWNSNSDTFQSDKSSGTQT